MIVPGRSAAAAEAPVVLWVASEAVPWASTGGLADVAGALPAVLRDRGWDVRLCLPLYGRSARPVEGESLGEVTLPEPAGRFQARFKRAFDPPSGVPTYFVDCPELFDRPGIYGEGNRGYDDNPLRFALFQIAARALAARLEPAPAIIHCHDWHTALLPALLHFPGQRPDRLADTRTLLTIHNLQYQGETGRDLLEGADLPRQIWHPRWAEHFGRFNPFKAGILSADRITTVSPTYANEVRTPERGFGLDGPLRERSADFFGILNGIDTVSWDPARDPALTTRYSVDEPWGRAACKAALRSELGFSPEEGPAPRPLIGYVGRLTPEKGVDLLLAAIPDLVALGADVVAIGSGDPSLEHALAAREREHHGRVRALRFEGGLARRVFAGVDLLVVPSRMEPCGLVQLYALRYGALPIVHATGGLRDTIRDGETGYLFHEPTPGALVAAVRRALEVYDGPRWIRLRDSCMRQDWSWSQSAAGYDGLYREVLEEAPWRRSLPASGEGPSTGPADWGPPLPARLGSEFFRLLPQGPRCLYAYWESATPGPLEVLLEERPSGIIYRVESGRPAVGDLWMGAAPERAYRAILRRADGTLVALSNAALTPRESPPETDEPPAWLDRALSIGLFTDEPREAEERWAELFPAAARPVPEPPPPPEPPRLLPDESFPYPARGGQNR